MISSVLDGEDVGASDNPVALSREDEKTYQSSSDSEGGVKKSEKYKTNRS